MFNSQELPEVYSLKQVHLNKTATEKTMQKIKGSSPFEDQDWKFITTFFVATVLLMVSFLSIPRQAMAHTSAIQTASTYAYNCGTASSNHCYGVNDWVGSITGAYSQINVVQLHAGNGVMNNSVWTLNSNTGHWIEAGYAVIYTKNWEFWYWAYIDNSGIYHEVDSSGLNHGDFGNPADVTIWQSSNNTWQASVYGWVTHFTPNSVTTSINPNYIQLGQELGGTSGSSASTANFNDNEWRDSNGVFHYQTVNGVQNLFAGGYSNPPYSGWDIKPSQPNSYGGSWYAYT